MTGNELTSREELRDAPIGTVVAINDDEQHSPYVVALKVTTFEWSVTGFPFVFHYDKLYSKISKEWYIIGSIPEPE